MNIGEIFQFVNFVLNKYQSASFSPDEFNQVLTATYLDPFKIKVGLPEEYQYPSRGANGSSTTGGVARQNYQSSQNITDDLRYFIKTITINRQANSFFFLYPEDYIRHSASEYDYVLNNNSCGGAPSVTEQSIEPVTDEQKKFRKNNTIVNPTSEYPIISFEDGGFLIDPKSVTTFRLTYLRRPVKPVFGYTLDAAGNAIYNPATSVQLDYPEIMHNDYCAMIGKYIGINIRDEEVVGFNQQRQISGQ